MIKLKPKRVERENNNALILYDREIDEFAHAVPKYYKLNLLKEPGAVRFEHFLESYLGVTLMYHDIYNDDSKHRILSATAFCEGYHETIGMERIDGLWIASSN